MSEAERAGTPRQDRSARLLAGRYRLGDVLGRGGMGTVWRAQDETLGRTVAVKELRFPSSIDEDEKRRLITRTLREAKAIARIRNTSAVTVFDVVQEDDRPWIVMELVEGKSLAEVIRQDGVLEPRRAAEVGLAVLDVLRSAHREGILHRDVKPSNVLIADDGRVVLTDFGIAQVEGDPSITSTGMLVGAPSYISPERARGQKPGPAADLWSLGGLLYAAVEGTPPYDKGSAIATLTAVMTEPVEEPGNAGPLKDVIMGLLVKDPARRLDDSGARALLNAAVHAPGSQEAEPEPADATKLVPLPGLPAEEAARGRQGEEPGEKLRGALRTVRKAAAAGSAKAAAAGSAKAAAARAAATNRTASPAPHAAAVPQAVAGMAGAPAGATAVASRSASVAAPAAGAAPSGTGQRQPSGNRGSGWPVMTPPDLPARPVPRAPLTDVVPRRTLVVIAVVAVLAVLGVILAVVLHDGDDEGGTDARAGGDRAAAGAPHSDTKSDENEGTGTDGTRTDGSVTGPADPEKKETEHGPGGNDDTGAGGSGGPQGNGGATTEQENKQASRTYRGKQGYSIELPEGWTYRSSGSAGDRFTGPDGQKLLIGWTTTPKDDPVADWKNQERGMRRAEYKRISIEAVEYRGWNTADWEFTYVEGGTTYRSVDRGAVVNDRLGYGLMYTAKADRWDSQQSRDTWRTLTETFEPKS